MDILPPPIPSIVYGTPSNRGELLSLLQNVVKMWQICLFSFAGRKITQEWANNWIGLTRGITTAVFQTGQKSNHAVYQSEYTKYTTEHQQ